MGVSVVRFKRVSTRGRLAVGGGVYLDGDTGTGTTAAVGVMGGEGLIPGGWVGV